MHTQKQGIFVKPFSEVPYAHQQILLVLMTSSDLKR